MRVVAAMTRQPEYRPYFGPLTWWGFRGIAAFGFVLRLRRRPPLLLTIERAGSLLGAVTISRSGQIGNLVVLGAAAEKRRVLRLLQAALGRELEGADRALWVITFATNDSIIAWSERRGFRLVPNRGEYVVTVPLGPLRFSWPQKRKPAWGWLRVTPMVRLERLATPRVMPPHSTGRVQEALRLRSEPPEADVGP